MKNSTNAILDGVNIDNSKNWYKNRHIPHRKNSPLRKKWENSLEKNKWHSVDEILELFKDKADK